MADTRKIIMAVDFGTTYSGLAWAQTGKPEIQTPIIQWPDATSGGLEGATSDKVPTELQYHGKEFKWGFQIPEFGERHQWFKLGLDPSNCSGASSALARDFPDVNAAPPGYDHDPEKLVTDYLTALRDHAEKVLRWKLPESALTSTPIEFMITTPAVWSESAQAKTRSCAQKAGMGVGAKLQIISEPEAAAMYALDAMDPHNIKIGDTFVLCDAGGGTVDLISYKVSALKPVLRIAEAAPGSGSACGSTFLNRIFQKYLKDKLGDDPDWDDDVVEEAMNRFDVTVKRSFSGQEEDEYQIPVPGLKDNAIRGVRRNKYRLTGADVKTIFEPVVKEVIALVHGQISATKTSVKAVLMVGGFGQNAYLRDCIRKAVTPLGIEVMQSPNGWTAVVRGALMKGLANSDAAWAKVNVTSRKARKHYGKQNHIQYVPNKHGHIRNEAFWSQYEGEWRINVMHWYVKKGESVAEQKPRVFQYYQVFPVYAGPPTLISSTISSCSDPLNAGAPLTMDTRVKDLVTVTADFGQIPPNFFPVEFGRDNVAYYKIEFGIRMTCYSAYTNYELIYKEINYGPVAAEYV